jgi:hypothetical protein
MARDVITLHPEIAEILRELSQKPGSALLRVPRKDVPRAVMESGSVVSARSATLDEAERHLVQVHREELAFVLRQAAYLRLDQSEDSRHLLVDRAVSSLRDHIPSEREVRIRSSDALHGDTARDGESEPLRLLESCAASSVSGWASAGQLASASHRLVPTDASRIYVALHLLATGGPGTALVVLRTLLSHSGSTLSRYAAWSNASLAYTRLSQLGLALDCAKAAARQSPRDYLPHVNRIWIAARLKLVEEVRQAAATLAAQFESSPQEANALAVWFRAARSARSAEVMSDLEFLDRQLEEWPPAVRRVFHEVH